jgi:hypothetical protein
LPDAVPRDPGVGDYLSALPRRQRREDAGGCLPRSLQMPCLRRVVAAAAGGLLRLLLVWLGPMPAGPAGERLSPVRRARSCQARRRAAV